MSAEEQDAVRPKRLIDQVKWALETAKRQGRKAIAEQLDLVCTAVLDEEAKQPHRRRRYDRTH